MKKRGRAQAAMEYILVASLLLLVFVPTTIIFLSHIRSSSDELTMSKLDKLGHDIVNNAEEVYYQGVPARITLRENMPNGVKRMYVLNNWTRTPAVNQLIIVYNSKEGEQELVFDSRVNINGTFSNESLSKGIKNIILNANRTQSGITYVSITIR
ncbi:hypothetical protein DRJ48_04105 [Candidatus Woesearchaeota archaeon]|nr:MAG: hypothetical protein DRJ48_04105 [Candidatus Woesearchaeota archaeon]